MTRLSTRTLTPRYWSMFWYGSSREICSEHATLGAAKKAAAACERSGGLKHHFVRVVRMGGSRD